MAIEHQLARLATKGAQITGEGFGGSGATLSQTDVAAALAGLKGASYWYMRLKFCGDVSYLPRLRHLIAWRILGDAMAGAMAGNGDISANGATACATVCLLQAIQGPLCEDCNGTGAHITADTAEDCQPCRGTGRLAMTQKRAAALAGVSIPTYQKRYAKIVDRYTSDLQGLEADGLAHAARRLYND